MQKLHTYNATLDGRQWRHELVVARDLLDDVHEQIEIERIAPVAEVAARGVPLVPLDWRRRGSSST